MRDVRFNSDWHYNGCQVLRLENDLLCLNILPEIGGKILNWIYKPDQRDWLWQNPRVKPTAVPHGTNYDDYWAGGWDDMFPNCAACRCEGESYPDHGEYWTKNCTWRVQEAGDEITLYLQSKGAATPTQIERWITLSPGSPAVRFKHRLTHLGQHGFHYLWAFHPGFAVKPGCQLLIPAGKGQIASPGTGRLGPEGQEFTWPNVPGRNGQIVDFSRIPGPTTEGGYEMVYLTEIKAGWFAVHDPVARAGFGLSFDHALFNSVWVFQTFGGWRGLHVSNIEPATGYPTNLPDAMSKGRCGWLEGGQVVETQSTAVVFTDRDRITHIDRDGTVH